MARLILLNGPPGIGKSTLARKYAEEHPLSLNLDIDIIRSLFGGWLNHQEESGSQARKLAIGMARSCLLDGHDVVIPQFLGRPSFVEQLELLACEMESEF